MIFKKIALAIVISFAFLILLIVLVAILFRYISYLTRPSSPKKAFNYGSELAKSVGKTFWVVVAHPDDAEWYAGGTLASLALKNRVILVMCTSGEKGANDDNLGAKREKLQQEAGKIIGYQRIEFLRFPDRELQKHKQQLERYLKRLASYEPPAAIFTFDFEKPHYIYRHADHLAAGEVAMKVSKELKVPLYLFHTSEPDVIFDYEKVKDKKKEALQVLTNYGGRRRAGALRVLRAVFSFLGRNRIEMYGFKESFPEINIEYGETFRLKMPEAKTNS